MALSCCCCLALTSAGQSCCCSFCSASKDGQTLSNNQGGGEQQKNAVEEFKRHLNSFKASLQLTMSEMIAEKVNAMEKLFQNYVEQFDCEEEEKTNGEVGNTELNEWATMSADNGCEKLLAVSSANQTVTHGKDYKLCTLRAKKPFSTSNTNQVSRRRHCSRNNNRGQMFYFEVKIIKMTESINIGLAGTVGGKRTIFHNVNNSGHFFDGNGPMRLWSYGQKFGEGDVIGCGLLMPKAPEKKRKMFFTKNGVNNAVPILLANDGVELFPAVRLWADGSQIQGNFGQEEFRYKLLID